MVVLLKRELDTEETNKALVFYEKKGANFALSSHISADLWTSLKEANFRIQLFLTPIDHSTQIEHTAAVLFRITLSILRSNKEVRLPANN